MKITELRDIIIPAISTFCGVPIIGADQTNDQVNGNHATYKFTTPYGKDAGMPNEVFTSDATGSSIELTEDYKTTISFTSYSMDPDESADLAQSIHDWFSLFGRKLLTDNGVAVVSVTDVDSRDAIILDEYERRNGFDVILRLSRKIVQTTDYFDKIVVNGETIENVVINGNQ